MRLTLDELAAETARGIYPEHLAQEAAAQGKRLHIVLRTDSKVQEIPVSWLIVAETITIEDTHGRLIETLKGPNCARVSPVDLNAARDTLLVEIAAVTLANAAHVHVSDRITTPLCRALTVFRNLLR